MRALAMKWQGGRYCRLEERHCLIPEPMEGRSACVAWTTAECAMQAGRGECERTSSGSIPAAAALGLVPPECCLA